MTSCEFAQNVRYAWFHQPGRIIEAYSPVTGQYYTMYCDPNYTARMDTGRVYDSVHCEGRQQRRGGDLVKKLIIGGLAALAIGGTTLSER